jgi:hypothetical protein
VVVYKENKNALNEDDDFHVVKLIDAVGFLSKGKKKSVKVSFAIDRAWMNSQMIVDEVTGGFAVFRSDGDKNYCRIEFNAVKLAEVLDFNNNRQIRFTFRNGTSLRIAGL